MDATQAKKINEWTYIANKRQVEHQFQALVIPHEVIPRSKVENDQYTRAEDTLRLHRRLGHLMFHIHQKFHAFSVHQVNLAKHQAGIGSTGMFSQENC